MRVMGMSKNQIKQLDDLVTYDDISLEATAMYERISKDKKWDVSVKQDPGNAPPVNTAAVVTEVTAQMLPQLLQCLQVNSGAAPPTIPFGDSAAPKKASYDTSKLICRRCGVLGHIAMECTKPIPTIDVSVAGWETTKPNQGQAKRMTVSGSLYYWCDICNAGKGIWSTHHGTKKHNELAPTLPPAVTLPPAPATAAPPAAAAPRVSTVTVDESSVHQAVSFGCAW